MYTVEAGKLDFWLEFNFLLMLEASDEATNVIV